MAGFIVEVRGATGAVWTGHTNMMRAVTKAELDQVDVAIKDLVLTINRLPFVRTRSSCAGYGPSSNRGRVHDKRDSECAYLMLQYDNADSRWENLHAELCRVARRALVCDVDLVAYYFGAPSIGKLQQLWSEVRDVVHAVKTEDALDEATRRMAA